LGRNVPRLLVSGCVVKMAFTRLGSAKCLVVFNPTDTSSPCVVPSQLPAKLPSAVRTGSMSAVRTALQHVWEKERPIENFLAPAPISGCAGRAGVDHCGCVECIQPGTDLPPGSRRSEVSQSRNADPPSLYQFAALRYLYR